MRYFAFLSYKGTHYHGWQRQPNAISVQQVIEEAMTTLLRQEIQVVGCGRTDRGVHASDYALHFDVGELPSEKEEEPGEPLPNPKPLPDNFLFRLNNFLPEDIAFRKIITVSDDAHTRFDATLRSYTYYMVGDKSPFLTDTAWHFARMPQLDIQAMQEAASLLLNYQSFFPFCKTNSDAQTMNCRLSRCEWIYDEVNGKLNFHISADRFLRGMVRLIVGMCVRVGQGRLSIDKVKDAMDQQKMIKESYSVPAKGLFLSEVKYDDLK